MPGQILYIEDDLSNLKLVQDILTAAGYRVVMAQSAEDGIQLATDNQPDLILIDMYLPRINGVEVIRHLRTLPQTQQTPIIGFSAHPESEKKCLDAGGNLFVSKPVTRAMLLDIVARYI
jgi:two-component system cell cycle response regulator DivK